MIPGCLITKKTSWRFDDLGGFRATFLCPKLDFFSCAKYGNPQFCHVYLTQVVEEVSFLRITGNFFCKYMH